MWHNHFQEREERYITITNKGTGESLRLSYDEFMGVRSACLDILPRDAEPIKYKVENGPDAFCALMVQALFGDVEERKRFAPLLTDYFLLLEEKEYKGLNVDQISDEFYTSGRGGSVWALNYWVYKAFEDRGLANEDLISLYDKYGLVKHEDGTGGLDATQASYSSAKATKAQPYIYDSGGVLQGLGGIKATTRDEAVLNPDHTEKFLKPQADKRLERVADQTERLMDLGGDLVPPEVLDGAIAATMAGSMGALSLGGHEVLTGARPMTPGVPTPETNVNRIGTQNNGGQYYLSIEKIPIQNITQGTTLGEIAQAARAILPLHRGGY